MTDSPRPSARTTVTATFPIAAIRPLTNETFLDTFTYTYAQLSAASSLVLKADHPVAAASTPARLRTIGLERPRMRLPPPSQLSFTGSY